MKLLVIFTFGISLKRWRDQGLLDREVLIYKKMIREKGYEIGFVTYGDDADLGLIDDIKVFPVYSHMKRRNKILNLLTSFLIPFRLKSIFKDYDLYKTNQMLGAWVAVIAKFLFKRRLIIRCGYEWLRTSYKESNIFKKIYIAILGYPLEFLCYALSDKIIVSSKSIFNFIKRFFKPFAQKVYIIPNFIDIDNFKKIDTAERKDRILYIGREHKRKNLKTLLKAIKDTTYGLDIVGSGNFQRLQEFADQNRIDMKNLGVVPNKKLPSLINRYPVFILASYFEDSPKTLLEAMACERLVVGSNVEGIRDLINDNVSGIKVSTDAEGIKEGLKKAFNLKDSQKIALGRKARELVTKEFSLDGIFEKEIAVYEGLKI